MLLRCSKRDSKTHQDGPKALNMGQDPPQRPPQDLVQRQVFMAVVGFRLLRRSKRGPKTRQDGPKTSSRDFGGSFQEWGLPLTCGANPPGLDMAWVPAEARLWPSIPVRLVFDLSRT